MSNEFYILLTLILLLFGWTRYVLYKIMAGRIDDLQELYKHQFNFLLQEIENEKKARRGQPKSPPWLGDENAG